MCFCIYYVSYSYQSISLRYVYNNNIELYQLYINYFIQIKIIDTIALLLHVALHIEMCLQPYSLSLRIQVARPSKCPLVDKPRPASVAGTPQAVAVCSRKEVAQAVQNDSSVTNRNYRQFSQDTLNGDDVEN